MKRDDLPTVIEIKHKAKLAGTRPYTYWSMAVAPMIPSLPEHLRQVMYARAYEVSMNIIPTPTMDNNLLPALLKRPHRSTIEWNKLTREYGVDRRYVATAYLYGLERLLATADEVTKARILQRNTETNTSTMLSIMSICVTGLMDRHYIASLLSTNKFDLTLGGFDPQRTIEKAERAAARQARRDKGLKATQTRYDLGFTWAHWREQRRQVVAAKADDITQRLLSYLHDNPGTSPIKYLATLCTTVTPKRPPLAAVLMYAHKHIFPRLARQQRWDIAETINAHALHFATHSLAGPKHLTSRIIISRLTGTLLPDTPAPGDDKARITDMVARCRGMAKMGNSE